MFLTLDQAFSGGCDRPHHAPLDESGMSQQTTDLIVMIRDKVRMHLLFP